MFTYIYVVFQTLGILDTTEFRTFWVKTESENSKFTIHVGKGGERHAFMSHTWDDQEHQINFVAFSSWYGHSGEWKILPHDFEFTTQDNNYKYYSSTAVNPEAGIICKSNQE